MSKGNWARQDSNLRRQSHQIYSLARELKQLLTEPRFKVFPKWFSSAGASAPATALSLVMLLVVGIAVSTAASPGKNIIISWLIGDDTSISESDVHPTVARPISGKLTLWRGRRKTRGCIYARYSTKFQQSIDDQIRACREWAIANGIDVEECHIYCDAGVSGKKRRRSRLSAMLAALDRGEIDVVITYATNRLSRKIHHALQFVEEEIVEKQRRCVFVAQRIDTADTKFWKALIYVFAMIDEFGIQMAAAHVREGHIGLVERQMVCGTLTFGYTGEIVPGEFTKKGNPRRKMVIDPATAEWVERIFRWYVDGRMLPAVIARRLREENVPPPPKVNRWSASAVLYLLSNRRYIGDFSYGWSEAVWQSKGDYSRQFKKEEPTHRHYIDKLRLIPDELFYAAQELTAQRKGRGGHPCHKKDGMIEPLTELLWCPRHEKFLSITGAGSNHIACRECKAIDGAENQPLYSSINRKLGRLLLFRTLARCIRADVDVVVGALDAGRATIAQLQKPDPQQFARHESQIKSLTLKISFILDNPGETDTDRAENSKSLAELRALRATEQRELVQLRARAAEVERPLPSTEELHQSIEDMAAILDEACSSQDLELHVRAMRILLNLTGGKIEVNQEGERVAKRGWLRGTFHPQLLKTLEPRIGDSQDDVPPVTIEFRAPTEAESIADEAKQLYDEGMLVKQIAVKLSDRYCEKISRNLVTRSLAHWHRSRGLEIPDGRSRRSTLDRNTIDPHLYQKVADDVMTLYNEQMLLGDIAEKLQIDRNTVTSSIRYWHEQRGLPVPDGRNRRKTLKRKSRTSSAA